MSGGRDQTAPQGLGGWLIIPILGLFLKPIAVAGMLYFDLLPHFQPTVWATLTTPGHENYHRLLGPLRIFELASSVVLAAAAILLLVLCFRRAAVFPTAIIAYYLVSLAALLIDHLVTMQIPGIVAFDGKAFPPETIRQILTTVIWVPYFLLSRRVKNTFPPRGSAPA